MMNDVSTTDDGDQGAMPAEQGSEAELRSEVARLQAELDDLRLLYDAVLEHGEAIEDQLAQQNLLLERTRQRLEAELADAARYVMSMLPDRRATSPKTDWLLVPSTELGGDSFGYRPIDDEHFAFYLIDVCGHGVGAALLSVAVINVLRTTANTSTDYRDPSAVLAALNTMFPMERQANMFFTIWYGVYNSTTGTLRFATGGHPPAILLRAAGTPPEKLITLGNMAIGAFDGLDFDSAEVSVGPGDRLLILSDGTFEIDKGEDDMLSFDELAAYAAWTSDIPSEIHHWVRSHMGDGPLPDDFSLVRVEF